MTPFKKQFDNLEALEEPYAELCIFEEADNISLLTKKHYEAAIMFA